MSSLWQHWNSLGMIEIIGHVAGALAAASFLLRDILLLRLFAICASSASIAFAYHGAAGPNFIPIFWQSLFIVINVVWSIILIRERAAIDFDNDEQKLYDTVFGALKPPEFVKLMNIAQWRLIAEEEFIAKAGEELAHVSLIFSGQAEVRIQAGQLRQLQSGAFVGEISYLVGGSATADVVATSETRIVSWPKAGLQRLLARDPALRATLTMIFSQDLAKKLVFSNERDYGEPMAGP